jgi:hypothetical protein
MSCYLGELNFQKNQRIIEYFIIGGLFFYQFVPTGSITLKFVILFCFLLSCLFQKSFHQIYNVRRFVVIVFISVILFFYHGLLEAKDYFILSFGILSLFYYGTKYHFSGNIIYKYFIYVIIPLSLLNFILYKNVYYTPFSTGCVNIIGNDATKHGTAVIGTVLFVGALYNILKSNRNSIKKDVIFLILSFYLVGFSGSRSYLLALIATIFLYYINKKRYKKKITIVYFFTMFSLVFFMEYLQNYVYLIKNDFILDLINAENFKQHGVTTGRAWLWKYHWDSFANSPYLLGGGREVTDFFVNEYIPSLRMNAKAGSESPFTGMLACYGIFGFFFLSILVFMSYFAIKKENLIATCIIFISIYNSTMGAKLTSVLHGDAILIYLLYFSSFHNNSNINLGHISNRITLNNYNNQY